MATDTDSSTLSSPLLSPCSSPPSSPLTEFSTSPSPPPDDFYRINEIPYPSPPASQQTSQTGSPTPDGMTFGKVTDKSGQPRTKRRRISRERSTEYLDLRSHDVPPEQRAELDRLLHVLCKRQKIVVIAGAGMSVSAGIPDFRSSEGLFRSLKDEYKLKGSGKHLFDASVYRDDTSTSSFHDMVRSMSHLTKCAQPTAFHHMLATIAQEDRLLRLYSQNVDGIDTSIEPLKTRVPLTKDEDGRWPRTVQLHGGLDKMVCSKCHELSEFDAALFSGPVAPLCPRCEEINDIRTIHEGKRSHGIGRLRPRMVLYNEHNPDELAIGSVTREDLRKRPDAVIVVGTTLKVPGVRRIVREMCSVVRDRRDGVAIWINNDLPPVSKDLEDCFDIVVRGTCDGVANRAAMRKWYEPRDEESYVVVSDEDAERAVARRGKVHLPSFSTDTVNSTRELVHANLEELPSSRHFNNSFSPPPSEMTPKRVISSPDTWSPMKSQESTILPSVENSVLQSNAQPLNFSNTTSSKRATDVTEHHLKTFLSKSTHKPKNSVSKPIRPKAKETCMAKSGRPASSAKGALPRSTSMPNGSLNFTFKTTKTAAVTARVEAQKTTAAVNEPFLAPDAAKPMLPLSPNSSLSRPRPATLFPGLKSEN